MLASWAMLILLAVPVAHFAAGPLAGFVAYRTVSARLNSLGLPQRFALIPCVSYVVLGWSLLALRRLEGSWKTAATIIVFAATMVVAASALWVFERGRKTAPWCPLPNLRRQSALDPFRSWRPFQPKSHQAWQDACYSVSAIVSATALQFPLAGFAGHPLLRASDLP